MKIIVCGPPHSGKSVLFTKIYEILPREYKGYFHACPDGESLSSNNHDQKMVQVVRRKGVFNNDFVNFAIKEIRKREKNDPILLIDTGGRRSPENRRIFAEADACIIVSSDRKEREEWEKFAKECNLTIIASLDSRLEGKDEVTATEPYIQGTITGLQRGKKKETASIILSIIDKIEQLLKKELENPMRFCNEERCWGFIK